MDALPNRSAVSAAPKSRHGGAHRLGSVAIVVAGILGAVVLGLAATNLLPAATNTVTLVGAIVWGFIGPALTVVALLAAAVTVPLALRRSRRWPARIVAGITVVALVSSGFITASIVSAALLNGGSINPVSALLSSTESTAADVDATYATPDGQPQHALVYNPKGAIAHAPVMVYVHGGGWVSGEAADAGAPARWFANQGWLVVSIDYRLATASTPAWNTAPADVGCALAWTARYAGEAGADPERFVVTGDSAGGNLALQVGWAAAAGSAVSSCPELGAVPVPSAIVAGYPVANPADTYASGRPWFFGQDPKDFTEDYLGGTPAEYPDRLAAISPETFLAADVPPTLIVQPQRDDFIPASGNLQVVADAQRSGADVAVIEVPFTHHAFDALTGSLGGQVKLTTALAWLKSKGLTALR
jgi:acetyl esterase/lipase